MSDEEKLRQEAARRLERRRRKLENANERLSLITGQPASSIRLDDSYAVDSSSADHSAGTLPDPMTTFTRVLDHQTIANGSLPSDRNAMNRILPDKDDNVPDPPLEALVRNPLQSSPSHSQKTPASPVSNLVWILLAAVSFVLLQCEYGHFIGHSIWTLFLLTICSLAVINKIEVGSTAGSIISTVLVLAGLKPTIVKMVIKSVEVAVTVQRYFVVYFTTFLVMYQLYDYFVVQKEEIDNS